jgi:hypothetical protein
MNKHQFFFCVLVSTAPGLNLRLASVTIFSFYSSSLLFCSLCVECYLIVLTPGRCLIKRNLQTTKVELLSRFQIRSLPIMTCTCDSACSWGTAPEEPRESKAGAVTSRARPWPVTTPPPSSPPTPVPFPP